MTESIGDMLARCARVIEEHGHGVIAVFPRVDDPAPITGFAYTYGLALQGKPELLLMGDIHPNTVTEILNDAVARDVDAPGDYDRVLKGFNVRAVTANAAGLELMVMARKFAPDRAALRALQILWPDPEERFPGDEGYDLSKWPQPVHSDD